MAFEGLGPLVTSASVWDREEERGDKVPLRLCSDPRLEEGRRAGGQGIHLCEVETYISLSSALTLLNVLLSE